MTSRIRTARLRPGESMRAGDIQTAGAPAQDLTSAAIMLRLFGAPASTFYEDRSEFQPAYTSSYHANVAEFRIDSGWRLDNRLAATWAYLKPSLGVRTRIAIGYVVFIPGQAAKTLARVKAFFGPSCPLRLVFLIDMESGSDFAGPGDHSPEANWLAAQLAIYAGNQARAWGYANAYDWVSNWPGRPAWMARVVASYGPHPPLGVWYAWQYAGGLHTALPLGYPSQIELPNVDLNVIQRDLDTIEADLGITQVNPPNNPALEMDDMPSEVKTPAGNHWFHPGGNAPLTFLGAAGTISNVEAVFNLTPTVANDAQIAATQGVLDQNRAEQVARDKAYSLALAKAARAAKNAKVSA